MNEATSLTFPKFLYGRFQEVRHKTEGEAARWVKAYQAQGAFPTPELAPVPDEAMVVLNHTADLDENFPQWRLYLLRDILHALNKALDYDQREKVLDDFETFTLQFAWGALDAALGHLAPNSIALVSRRVTALLNFWQPLSRLRYIDRELTPVSLDTVVLNHFGSLIRLWGPAVDPSVDFDEDPRSSLQQAVVAMRNSPPQEVRERVITALSGAAAGNPKVTHPALFQDRQWINAALDALEPAEYDNLTAGHLPGILREVYILDENADGKP